MAKIFSREDGDLSTSIRIVKDRVYSDIDLSFFARTSTDGDIYRKLDAAAVKQALKTLLLTNRFEKPYRPQFGGNLSGLLFDLMDQETGKEIISSVKNAVATWEPRVKLLNVKVTATPEYNLVDVIIEFRVIKTEEVVSLRIPLDERSRQDYQNLLESSRNLTLLTPSTLPITPPPPAQDPTLNDLLFTDITPAQYDENGNLIITYLIIGIDGNTAINIDVNEETILNGAILTTPDEDQLTTQDGLILIVQNYPDDSKFEP